ncbi:hypothetical protein CXG46_18325 [Nocardioides alpinus]|uniref:Uncharacterized protein n=1 Tax=Nocardioides alpinus TaxID=748909 RepID=A0ABX4QRZ4_9ACTN|nr:hypothetical protein CXG46_18325 [Nocardioides alpinus]
MDSIASSARSSGVVNNRRRVAFVAAEALWTRSVHSAAGRTPTPLIRPGSVPSQNSDLTPMTRLTLRVGASVAGSVLCVLPVIRAARVSARTCPPVRVSPSARAVALRLGVGGEGEARAACGLAELEVAESGESGCEVGVDLVALLGGEVGDLAGEGERAVLGELTAPERGQGQGEVVTQATRQQHPLLPGVRAGEGGQCDLGADRHRPRRRTTT